MATYSCCFCNAIVISQCLQTKERTNNHHNGPGIMSKVIHILTEMEQTLANKFKEKYYKNTIVFKNRSEPLASRFQLELIHHGRGGLNSSPSILKDLQNMARNHCKWLKMRNTNKKRSIEILVPLVSFGMHFGHFVIIRFHW